MRGTSKSDPLSERPGPHLGRLNGLLELPFSDFGPVLERRLDDDGGDVREPNETEDKLQVGTLEVCSRRL